MKKILFSLLFTLCYTFLFAQDQSNTRFKLGLTAHPTFGWLKSDNQGIKSDGLRAGFSYGLIGDFYFASNYAFSTGLKLTTINGQTKSELSANNGEQDIYKLQYIEIPAKLKLTTNELNKMKFYGEFGLGNGFNVRAREDIKGSATPVSNQNISKQTSFYRASLIIGGGAEFLLSDKTSFTAGLSYDNGFTDIQSGSGTLKSSYLGLNLSVFF